MPGEFELIARHFSPATHHTVLAGGDDAALIAPPPGMELAVSTDMLVAGRHFPPDADPASVGHKSLAVNLSDMAAMGARPRWATLSLALPAIDEAWIAAFMRGFMTLAADHDVDLVGGDTTSGPLNLCVQIIGDVPAGQALRRCGACAGDLVWVSGTLGEAAVGLRCLRGEWALPAPERARCLQRLERPQPRVQLGVALRGIAHAAIDVSDGLVADLGHIAGRSSVRAVVRWPQVPRPGTGHDGPALRECVLAGGDDYELCFTAPAHATPAIHALAQRFSLPLTAIGHIEQGSPGVTVYDADGAPLVLQAAGFDHFRTPSG
ncbi:MAG: thiamine-phosphate kinase [Burkholderiales bacterium]|nr:thiamine-phosphate kinase [Burkholderiales bacterium]